MLKPTPLLLWLFFFHSIFNKVISLSLSCLLVIPLRNPLSLCDILPT